MPQTLSRNEGRNLHILLRKSVFRSVPNALETLLNLLPPCSVYPIEDKKILSLRKKEEECSHGQNAMNDKLKNSVVAPFMVTVFALLTATLIFAQAATRYLGTITAIDGATLTVKTDAGETHQVEVPSTASLKRIEPGQKDLSSAETIQFSDLASGDRVLVRLDPNAAGATPQALQIVAIKQADVAAKQQKDREDWQRRGVGGLVKSVDAASGVIVVTSGAGAATKTIAVHTGSSTVLRRYSSSSVKFDDAKPAPIDAIKPGDQLRARGQRNPDGAEIAADEVVSGSFRNISGTVVSIDAASASLVVKDLAAKKQVTIHITPDAQMRRLPDRMAQAMAARLKGGAGGGSGAPAGTPPGTSLSPSGGTRTADPGSPAGGHAAQNGGAAPAGNAPGNGDPQQMLNRAPAIQLADLQKGEAVMIVATEGASDVTAVTLLAGVEPLLEAPAASNLLSNWSMGGGADAAGAQ